LVDRVICREEWTVVDGVTEDGVDSGWWPEWDGGSRGRRESL